MTDTPTTEQRPDPDASREEEQSGSTESRPKEIGGRSRGLDPTRYGDWEKNGRCIDF